MSEHLPIPDFTRKIVSFEDLRERASELPHPIVMTNGVFDILHRGHVTYLAQAAALGKSLVVAVNSDASVRMLGKGMFLHRVIFFFLFLDERRLCQRRRLSG